MLSTHEQTDRIRRLFDEFPFPATDPQAILNADVPLPATAWCNALARIDRAVLAPGGRVLVAGCGTGAEAFAWDRAMPGMEIVAVDFSEKSIAVARAPAKNAGASNLEFVCADLTDPTLPETLGSFDFVSCRHVLEFIPDSGAALANLARLAQPDGCVCLQVKTDSHPDVDFRDAMPFFELDPGCFVDSKETRDRLRVMQRLRDPAKLKFSPPLHQRAASLLAADLFCPSSRYLPFPAWVRLAEERGLHLCGTADACAKLVNLSTPEEREPLAAMDRARIAVVNDLMARNIVEHIFLSPRPPVFPDWTDPESIPDWRPIAQFWDRAALPRKSSGQGWNQSAEIGLKIGSITEIRGAFSWWVIEFLRRCHGRLSVREILAGLEGEAGLGSLSLPVSFLNQLYHGMVLNFLPPRAQVQN